MRSKKVFLLLFALGLFLFPSPVSAEDVPFVEPGDCPIEVPDDVEIDCGYLIVPENYDIPEGRWIRLPYIFLHSKSTNPAPDPLLFTEGGPGGNSLQSVWGFKDSVFLQDRDVIIFQQRGNLYADPELSCSFDELFDRETGTSPCADKFREGGIDLTQYTTAKLAEDIESLRVALGYEEWNLYGTSYSTRLMQVLMDRHPEGIHSVILQSVNILHETRYQYDPEHSYRVLEVMFEDCEADPDCAASFPDLEERFFDLVKEYNQAPIKLELTNPETGERYPYEVSGYTLIDWMVGRAFYGPTQPPFTTAFLPLLIDQLSKGRREILTPWAQNEVNNDIFAPDFIAFGLYFTVNCQDDAGSVTEEDIEEQAAAYPEMDGFYRHLSEWELCQLWDLPTAAPLADAPISSDIPTLVLAGRYDPITPPAWSRMVADNLTNATYVEFPSKGHNLDAGSTCAEEIKRSFLQDPSIEPDTSCLADEMPPTYTLLDEVIPADGFIQSVEDIDFGVPERGNLAFEIISYASLILFIIEIVAFLVIGCVLIFSQSTRTEKTQKFAFIPHIFAALVAGLSFGSVILLSLSNQTDIQVNQTLAIFGLRLFSPIVTWLGVVVIAQIIFGIILVCFVICVWLDRQSTVFNRITLSLVSIGGMVFWFFYFRWELVKIFFH